MMKASKATLNNIQLVDVSRTTDELCKMRVEEPAKEMEIKVKTPLDEDTPVSDSADAYEDIPILEPISAPIAEVKLSNMSLLKSKENVGMGSVMVKETSAFVIKRRPASSVNLAEGKGMLVDIAVTQSEINRLFGRVPWIPLGSFHRKSCKYIFLFQSVSFVSYSFSF